MMQPFLKGIAGPPRSFTHLWKSPSICFAVRGGRGGGRGWKVLRWFIRGQIGVNRFLGLGLSTSDLGRDYGSRALRYGFQIGATRVSRNMLAFDELECRSTHNRRTVTEVYGCKSDNSELGPEGTGSFGSQKIENGESKSGVTLVLNVQEPVDTWCSNLQGTDLPNDVNSGAPVGEQIGDNAFPLKKFIVEGGNDPVMEEKSLSNNKQPGKREANRAKKMAKADSAELLSSTVWPKLQGEPERWWQIPDLVHEVLPLPKNFELQLEILYDKFGCRIQSRELLLRILVHKSYYVSNMPPALKEKKLLKPSSSLELSERRQRTEIMDATNLMTFADAHGEARSQLALVGDTVLSLATSLHLIRQHPFLSTGIITERRSQLVCNNNLARVWSTLLGLHELVLCDPLFQSRKPTATTFLELQLAKYSGMVPPVIAIHDTNALADTLEAYVGGLFVEKGLESALQCVEARLLPLLLLADPKRNPVVTLQEQCLVLLQVQPEYKLVGIDNRNSTNETSRIRVYVKGIRMSTGVGKSQKLAKRDAAEKALVKWREVFGSGP